MTRRLGRRGAGVQIALSRPTVKERHKILALLSRMSRGSRNVDPAGRFAVLGRGVPDFAGNEVRKGRTTPRRKIPEGPARDRRREYPELVEQEDRRMLGKRLDLQEILRRLRNSEQRGVKVTSLAGDECKRLIESLFLQAPVLPKHLRQLIEDEKILLIGFSRSL